MDISVIREHVAFDLSVLIGEYNMVCKDLDESESKEKLSLDFWNKFKDIVSPYFSHTSGFKSWEKSSLIGVEFTVDNIVCVFDDVSKD